MLNDGGLPPVLLEVGWRLQRKEKPEEDFGVDR